MSTAAQRKARSAPRLVRAGILALLCAALAAACSDDPTGLPGLAASIELTPQTVLMTDSTYQMTVTVRDGAGNVLADPAVAWSTSDPSGLMVSASGLLTALANGDYTVTANVEGLEAAASVTVLLGGLIVTISPAPATLRAGGTIVLTATLRDTAGLVLGAPDAPWTSSDPAVATVVPTGRETLGQHFGLVTGISPGTVTITATSGAASGAAEVTVTPAIPVASVTLSLEAATLFPQATVRLSATLRDADGNLLDGRPIEWASDEPAVATVDAIGQVTAVAPGSAAVTATSEGVSDTAAITVRVISFQSVSSAWTHTCGVATDGTAYCWGFNYYGLGDGSRTYSTLPVAVAGGLTVSRISAGGGWHNCILTTAGAAYCWGLNSAGALGDGSTNQSAVPVAVAGGLTFSGIEVGGSHTCALAQTGEAYCWGWNDFGQLGDGSRTDSTLPVAVSGGLRFVSISVGSNHSCGLTVQGAAYCWGGNWYGELGDGTFDNRSVPVAVTGGLTFSVLGAGIGQTCGITADGAAYCWGEGWSSEYDDNYNKLPSPVPVAVPGGPYSTVSVNADGLRREVCVVETSGAVYCGSGYGFAPVAVGFTFSALSVGAEHWCGIASGPGIDPWTAAVCWGDNRYGQLGDGTLTSSAELVWVAGQR